MERLRSTTRAAGSRLKVSGATRRKPVLADQLEKKKRAQAGDLRPTRATAGGAAPGITARRPGLARDIAPLTERDFGPAITLDFLRQLVCPPVEEAAFRLMLKSALKSTDQLLRTFPGVFWADLAPVVRAGRFPGKLGVCFGDGHPSNFGWKKIGKGSVYAYGDLDDSDLGPVALDALRTLTMMKLEDGHAHRFIEQYSSVVRHPENAVRVPQGWAPDWEQRAEQKLGKLTHHDRFVLSDATGLAKLKDASTREAITRWATHEPALPGLEILDIAMVPHTTGGSGGLTRYWILGQQHGQRRLIELKQETTPGVARLGIEHQLSPAERLDVIKKVVLGKKDPADEIRIMLGGTAYRMRDRLAMEAIEPLDLGKHQRKRYLEADISEMARIHRAGWGGLKKPEIVDWLTGSMPAVIDRWDRARNDLRRELAAL